MDEKLLQDVVDRLKDSRVTRILLFGSRAFVYFHGVVPGMYVPIWPVFVVEDHPDAVTCRVAIDPAYATGIETDKVANHDLAFADDFSLGIRRYVAAFTKRRLHQTSFRERVITAYHHTCMLCRLAAELGRYIA